MLMFFTPEQYKITEAAAERIYPADDLGPGAKDLNAPIYIDHQLASPWGVNTRDYMSGPFHKPKPTQGPQIKVLRKDLFLLGLTALNKHSEKNHKNSFVNLEPSEQDEVLKAFEAGKADSFSGISSDQFFNMLRTLTIEGV